MVRPAVSFIIIAGLATAVVSGSVAVGAAQSATGEGEPVGVDAIMKGIIDRYEQSTRQRLDRARQRLGAPPPPGDVLRQSQTPPAGGMGVVLQDCAVCPPMLIVPAGTGVIGSPVMEAGRGSDEAQRTVQFAKPFALGRSEVTVREFSAFLGDTGYAPKGDCYHWHDRALPVAQRQTARPLDWAALYSEAAPDGPASCIGWHDATAYVEWLTKKTGHSYRLPSEAEWEYAARAGTATAYWWGTAISQDSAVYGYNDRTLARAQAARPAPNGWGFVDMNGSVWEWAQDCYQPRPLELAGMGKGAANNRGGCAQRVGRGGSWGNAADDLRAANRLKAPPGYRSTLFGLRVARTLSTD